MKSGTAGRLASIIRQILHPGNLHTHPFSEKIKEADSVVCDKDQELKAKENIKTTTKRGQWQGLWVWSQCQRSTSCIIQT